MLKSTILLAVAVFGLLSFSSCSSTLTKDESQNLQDEQRLNRLPAAGDSADPSCLQMYQQGLSRCEEGAIGDSEDGRDLQACEARLSIDHEICCEKDRQCKLALIKYKANPDVAEQSVESLVAKEDAECLGIKSKGERRCNEQARGAKELFSSCLSGFVAEAQKCCERQGSSICASSLPAK
jgi:hypothetical protein